MAAPFLSRKGAEVCTFVHPDTPLEALRRGTQLGKLHAGPPVGQLLHKLKMSCCRLLWASLWARKVNMKDLTSFQVENLVELVLPSRRLKPPIDLPDQRQECHQHQGLQQQKPSKGHCHVSENPLAEAAIVVTLIGLLSIPCSLSVLQHHDQGRDHCLLVELLNW